MADAVNPRRPERTQLVLAQRRREPLDILWREVVVFKTDITRMRRMIVIAFYQEFAVLSSAFKQSDGL